MDVEAKRDHTSPDQSVLLNVVQQLTCGSKLQNSRAELPPQLCRAYMFISLRVVWKKSASPEQQIFFMCRDLLPLCTVVQASWPWAVFPLWCVQVKLFGTDTGDMKCWASQQLVLNAILLYQGLKSDLTDSVFIWSIQFSIILYRGQLCCLQCLFLTCHMSAVQDETSHTNIQLQILVIVRALSVISSVICVSVWGARSVWNPEGSDVRRAGGQERQTTKESESDGGGRYADRRSKILHEYTEIQHHASNILHQCPEILCQYPVWWNWTVFPQQLIRKREKEAGSLYLIKSWPTQAARPSNTTEQGETLVCMSVHLSVSSPIFNTCLTHVICVTCLCLVCAYRPSFTDRKRLGLDRKRSGSSRWVWPFLSLGVSQRKSQMSDALFFPSGSKRRSER